MMFLNIKKNCDYFSWYVSAPFWLSRFCELKKRYRIDIERRRNRDPSLLQTNEATIRSIEFSLITDKVRDCLRYYCSTLKALCWRSPTYRRNINCKTSVIYLTTVTLLSKVNAQYNHSVVFSVEGSSVWIFRLWMLPKFNDLSWHRKWNELWGIIELENRFHSKENNVRVFEFIFHLQQNSIAINL